MYSDTGTDIVSMFIDSANVGYVLYNFICICCKSTACVFRHWHAWSMPTGYTAHICVWFY